MSTETGSAEPTRFLNKRESVALMLYAAGMVIYGVWANLPITELCFGVGIGLNLAPHLMPPHLKRGSHDE